MDTSMLWRYCWLHFTCLVILNSLDARKYAKPWTDYADLDTSVSVVSGGACAGFFCDTCRVYAWYRALIFALSTRPDKLRVHLHQDGREVGPANEIGSQQGWSDWKDHGVAASIEVPNWNPQGI